MELNQIRLIKLLGGESMKLIEEPSMTLFTVTGIKDLYLVLIHNIGLHEFNDAKLLFINNYRNLANADIENASIQFLESSKIYHLLFNDITERSIPRSSVTGQFEGDLLVYISQYEIIEGW